LALFYLPWQAIHQHPEHIHRDGTTCSRRACSTALHASPDACISLLNILLSISVEVDAMNQDTIKGQWKQLGGKLKAQWGKLTDDDLKVAEGDSQYLSGKLQERYGIARDEAEKQIKQFEKTNNLH
jgi:uncharacterized protein YjbJ (UPF0337 family)